MWPRSRRPLEPGSSFYAGRRALLVAVFDQLREAGWIRPGPRLNAPGAPQTWVTTETFLEQFGLTSLRDLCQRAGGRHVGVQADQRLRHGSGDSLA